MLLVACLTPEVRDDGFFESISSSKRVVVKTLLEVCCKRPLCVVEGQPYILAEACLAVLCRPLHVLKIMGRLTQRPRTDGSLATLLRRMLCSTMFSVATGILIARQTSCSAGGR